MLVPIVFGVIWASMGELNADVFRATGFFALVTFFLALWSRGQEKQGWCGKIERKWVKEVRRKSEDGPVRVEHQPMIEVTTDRGKRVNLRVGAPQYAYFEEGDAVMKVPGFSWPVKQAHPDGERICLVCGGIVPAEEAPCPRCRAPLPDHGALREVMGLPPLGPAPVRERR